MTIDRLVVRLDADRRKKLVELTERRQQSMSDLIRDLIDNAYEIDRREYLMSVVDKIASLNIEDVPDPDELSRQLAAKYDFERLC